MIRWIAVFICLAGQASALSCLPHSVQAAYQNAAEAEDVYVVIHGKLSFDKDLLPVTDWDDQMNTPDSTPIPARISGKMLTATGFDRPAFLNLTFDVRCYGPWCASGVAGADYLAFVKQTPTGYVLETNPCGGFAFATPSPEQIQAVEACHAGKSCDAPGLR